MNRRAQLLLAILVVALSWSVMAAAEEATEQREEGTGACEDCYRVDAILIEGLLRTRRKVVERELTFEEGDSASVEDVEFSLQRLRNMGLFHRVEYRLEEERVGSFEEVAGEADEPRGRLLRLRVEERWTLAPSFRFGSGGETFHLQLGLQDVNVLGSYLQAGGSYSRLGETNSFSFFFRDPRFLNRRQRVSVDVALQNRMQSSYTKDGELEGSYLLTRRRGGLSLRKEWNKWLRTSVNTSFYGDSFSFENIVDERREAQEERGGLPGAMQTFQVGAGAILGRINRDGYHYSGTEFTAQFSQFFHSGDVAPRSQKLSLGFRHFSELAYNSTLGLRAKIGFSNQDPEHLQFSAGGLDALRGTVDMRYRGPHLWQSNLEYRIPSVENSWIIVQNVFFVDAVGVTQYAETILDLTAATAGLGLRFISPTISGMIIRVDYALPIMGADGPGLSFGAGQFF